MYVLDPKIKPGIALFKILIVDNSFFYKHKVNSSLYYLLNEERLKFFIIHNEYY